MLSWRASTASGQRSRLGNATLPRATAETPPYRTSETSPPSVRPPPAPPAPHPPPNSRQVQALQETRKAHSPQATSSRPRPAPPWIQPLLAHQEIPLHLASKPLRDSHQEQSQITPPRADTFSRSTPAKCQRIFPCSPRAHICGLACPKAFARGTRLALSQQTKATAHPPAGSPALLDARAGLLKQRGRR